MWIEIRPVTVSSHSAVAWVSDSHWPVSMMVRRSWRSASTPPNNPTARAGNRSAKATAPSQNPEWVRSQASQPTPNRCTHVPISESVLPDA